MRVGAMDVHLLSDGVMKADGGAMFGQVPKAIWENLAKPDRRNRVLLGINSLLIRTGEGNVLVDTGVGTKYEGGVDDSYGIKASRLMRRLRDLGTAPADIACVVLTHLHFDHTGGSTRRNRRGETVPTFPRARYLVQEQAWADACSPNERARGSFFPHDYLPLQERQQVELLEGDHEVAPGVRLLATGGHCRGHQVVQVIQPGGTAVFLGDLVPTPYHLGLPCISAFDQHPEETLEQKRAILGRAEQEGWLLLFSHGHDLRAGYLERRDGHLILRPVSVQG